jgi:hypothetical protein
MKPKPFSELKNFTIPVVTDCSSQFAPAVLVTTGIPRGYRLIVRLSAVQLSFALIAGRRLGSASIP